VRSSATGGSCRSGPLPSSTTSPRSS
jgi:hypothetical protein